MPTYLQGDMFSVLEESDHWFVTTNSVVKNNGALVMGAGIAKQIRDEYPGIDHELGQEVLRRTDRTGFYGLIIGFKLGIFQVKHHWRSPADLGLIRRSTRALHGFAQGHPTCRIDLNFPGIGFGGLSPEQVKPVIDGLPDNVHIWTFQPH